MSSTAGPARKGGRLTTFYVATWGILAAVALAYLVILAFRPDVGAGIVTRISPAETEPTQVQRTISKALAELQSVRQSVAEVWTQVAALKEAMSKQEDQSRVIAQLGHDLEEVRSTMAGQDERGRLLVARLAAVESRQGGADNPHIRTSLQSAQARGAPHLMAGATVTGSVDDSGSRAANAEAKAVAPRQPRERLQEKQTAAAVASGAPKVTAAPRKAPAISGLVGLQLGTAPSTDALRLTWLRISSINKDALQDLEPRFVEVKIASGVTYRLLAGPVANSEEGARMCAELKERKVSCAVASFKGEPL